uniref:OSJNBa0061C06.21 protein n=1 Tax=Oryza sativa subsp. japonica TaxID=39947 RepID=Q5JQV1_ORYSJ|nr:OSJNBa0061C06.21 [Oryza sativa Japonica Group]
MTTPGANPPSPTPARIQEEANPATETVTEGHPSTTAVEQPEIHESPQEQHTSMSGGTSASRSSRNPRSQNIWPTTMQVIREVDASGRPTAPRTVIGRWSNCCGLAARENFRILHKDIGKVTEAEKERAWTAMEKWFTFPAEAKDRLKRKAFHKMGKAWKNWKSKLFTEFVNPPGNYTPFDEYPQITKAVWEEFCSLKNTQEFRESSEAHRLLQQRNEHPHRLGTAGRPTELTPPKSKLSIEAPRRPALSVPHSPDGANMDLADIAQSWAPIKTTRKADSSPPLVKGQKHERGKGKVGELAPEPKRGKAAMSMLASKAGKVVRAAAQFELGMPLVEDNVLAVMGISCRELHKQYMELSNAKQKMRESSIVGHHDHQPFLSSPAYITVTGLYFWGHHRLAETNTSDGLIVTCPSEMDRQWMYADRRSKEFIEGVHYFLRVAEANKRNGFICCPCNKCKNQKEYFASKTIHFHLFESGFIPSYNCWTSHGEQGVEMEEDEAEDENIPDWAQYTGFEGNQMGEVDKDAGDNDAADNLGQMLQDAKEDYESEKEAHKLEQMLEDHGTSLYPGCEQGHKKLDTTLEFLQWKAKNGVSDKAFGDLLKLVKNILPKGNKLPETTYDAKKIVCPLGLEVQKIHACSNYCILYRGEEYENLETCPVCKALRYKIRREDPGEVDGNMGNARMMCWHAEERQQDGMLRHPADGSQWRNIDRKFKDFGKDARNIRFGLSTDGMNPFGEMSSGHSTWPVTMCIYNLPPWLCMKRKYIMMPIIIQGPKQPGNDFDVYLRPLVEDLKLLWKKEGVPMWDEDKQEEFNLRVLLFITINDWLALSNLSGQSNKGYKACTHCMDETKSTYLKHCRKVVYMGHRRFLAANHPVWKKGKHFEHKADHRTKPKHRSGKTMFAMVKDLKVVFGKGPGSQLIESEDGHAAMWKNNYILGVTLLGILGRPPRNRRVYGKSKDTLEARNDLKHMEQRGDLLPEPKEKGSHYLSPASYTLSKAEKESMFECLESIKVPFGYSTNIKRIISTKEKKFTNLKSHDCHVLMTQLLPVVIRGILPDNVRATITKLCAFMNAISQKVIVPDRLEAHQNDVVQCLVSFELIFLPSFFNIMTHLLRHLVKEIGILGPVYLHNMFPFERYMGILKKYVRNRARPEATIAKGYGIEEVIEFCVEFIEDLRPIGVPESHHEGRLREKGTLGRKAIMMVDNNLFRKVHFTVLQQSSLVAPYIEEHLALVCTRNIGWIQVFYVKDMSSKGKMGKGPDEPKHHVVLPGKRKIVGVENKTDEDYDQLDGQPPFTVTIDPSILLSNEDTPYSRSDHKEGTIVRRKKDVVVVPQARVMADRDEEQILYDTIAEGSSQYWNKEEGNEDPNQYMNEEGNVERDAEGNEEGNDNVPVSTVYWRRTRARGDHESFVPDSEKEMLWTTLLETFTLPAGTENIVKRWTLKKMVEQFQSFKGDLYQKYILKGQTPNFNTFPKLRDHWDEFVAYKTGQQGQAMMERNKENAAKKKYHHHLGSGGYSVAMPKWEEMEASLIERGIEPATAKWPDRSKFWYYAHGGTLNPVDGSLVFSDQIREVASRLTDAVEASSQGMF